jgi:uncharacterized membrane protein
MNPIRLFPHALLGALTLAVASCDLVDNDDVICTDHFEYGLSVAVQDSLTGAPAASGARLIARDGAYADTATVPAGAPDSDPDSGVLQAAGERPGTYAVTVEKSGFLTWQRNNVIVAMDDYGCHVVPVQLTARLQRAP